MKPLVEMKRVCKDFAVGGKILKAVQDVNLHIDSGETLGLVGESGCGKSTLGRLLMRLQLPSSGSLFFAGRELTRHGRAESKQLRREMQIIFQDPYASLNPRMIAKQIVCEPLIIHGMGNAQQRQERAEQLLRLVGLTSDYLERYPHELSGGQRQRIGIARAIALEPKFLVCDEPVSALDASTQKQVLNLLKHLKSHLGMTYLFFSHDLDVIRQIANRVAVMYLGRLMEVAPTKQIYSFPKHPYTQALLSAIPVPDPKIERSRLRIVLTGDLPSPFNPPTGCAFHTRCPRAEAICRTQVPVSKETEAGHWVSCHFV